MSGKRVNLVAGALLVSLLTCVFSLNGQVRKFDIGFEGGPSFTTLRGNESLRDFYDSKIEYSGGFIFQYNFPRLVSIRTNITYERKGAVGKIITTDAFGNQIDDTDADFDYDYLTLPVKARLTFGRKWNFFVNAGPYFGFLIKQTTVIEAYDHVPVRKIDNTDRFKRLDAGLTGGVGCILPIKGNLIITIEIRHNLGLYNISVLPVINDGKILTNSTSLLIGCAYRFGSRRVVEQ